MLSISNLKPILKIIWALLPSHKLVCSVSFSIDPMARPLLALPGGAGAGVFVGEESSTQRAGLRLGKQHKFTRAVRLHSHSLALRWVYQAPPGLHTAYRLQHEGDPFHKLSWFTIQPPLLTLHIPHLTPCTLLTCLIPSLELFRLLCFSPWARPWSKTDSAYFFLLLDK